MSHFAFIFVSYAVTALVLAGLVLWVLADQRARLAELAELEAQGVRRRSSGGSPASGDPT